MTTVFVVAGIVVLLIATVFGIGAMLPQEHQAQAERVIPTEPERIWKLLTNPDEVPEWRSDVAQVRQLSPNTVRETDKSGKSMTFETVRSDPPRVLVRRIADADLPFGGHWTITIEPVRSGSRVRVVEDGFVRPPLFRFVSRFVLGHERTIKTFLDDLESHVAKLNKG